MTRRRIRIAWIDVAIQVMGIALIAWAVWLVLTSGVFSQGVGLFSGWYTAFVAPELTFDGLLPAGPTGMSVFEVADPGSILRPVG